MDDQQIIDTTKETISEFLTQMGLDADVEARFEEADEERDFRYLATKLTGENLQELIGYHGRNLESSQIILGVMINKRLDEDSRIRLLLDINDYKVERKKYLESLAIRAAEQVRDSGQTMELEPMKPYERRIVHMLLEQEDGIQTESKGEDHNRRIVISATEINVDDKLF